MTVGGIKYSDPLNFGQNDPYDGDNIKSNRKGGWMVRHKLLGWKDGKIGRWINDIPSRTMADEIYAALVTVARISYDDICESDIG